MGLYIIIIALFGLALGAIAYYPCMLIIQYLGFYVEVPATIGGTWLNFNNNLLNWFLLFGVVIPLLIYVTSNSRQPRGIAA